MIYEKKPDHNQIKLSWIELFICLFSWIWDQTKSFKKKLIKKCVSSNGFLIFMSAIIAAAGWGFLWLLMLLAGRL